jgi:predicted nucleic acid-binding protein
MSDPEQPSLSSLSHAATIEEIGDFWDTHSLADYEDHIQEVEFEVRAPRRHRISLDPDVYTQIAAQAQHRGISPETLINLWLLERLHKVS